jgi:SMC interacting uncharacterized protein involved in chromosome segregation
MMINAKEYLREIKVKRNQLKRFKDRRSSLHLDVSFGGIDYSADRVQSTPQNKLENAMIKLSDRMAYLDRKIAELSVEIDDRINSIEAIQNGSYRDILFKHYAEYKSFEQISVEMGYVYNYTCNLHGEALKELTQLLN